MGCRRCELPGVVWAVLIATAASGANAPTPPKTAAPPANVGTAITVDLRTAQFKVPSEEEKLFGYDEQQKRLFFHAWGPVELGVEIPEPGDYEMTVRASCDAIDSARVSFRIILETTAGAALRLSQAGEHDYKIRPNFRAGAKRFYLEFVTDARPNEPGSRLYIHAVTFRKLPPK